MVSTPDNGFFKPKKAKLQPTLTASCVANKTIPMSLTLFLGDSQTKNKAVPTKMNNMVHTGPNTQLGGVNEGLFNAAYHVGMACMVGIAPMMPASKHTPIDTISLITVPDLIDILIEAR